MTHENKMIKEANATKTKLEAKAKTLTRKIMELQDILLSTKSRIYREEETISFYKKENFYKKQGQLLEKQYDFLHIDEIHEDVIWFSCDLYDEHNEEADPYYDAHFVDCWRALHNAFSEYINIAIDKKVVT